MSLYAEYIKEREGMEIIEIPDMGFASYLIKNQECYMRDVYIIPSLRRTGLGGKMADKIENIAKARGCKIFTTTASIHANNVSNSIQFILSLGFKLVKTESTLLWFVKEL